LPSTRVPKELKEGIFFITFFFLQNVMRSNPAKEHLSRLKLKSETVVHGHRTFPAIYRPGNPFDPKRWVIKIIEKKGKFFVESFLYLLGQGFVFLLEPAAECIADYSFSNLIPSSAV